MKNCYNTGDVNVQQGNTSFAGGIAGTIEPNSSLDCSYNTGDINVQQGNVQQGNNSSVGGIVGAVQPNSSLSYSYNTGNVIGNGSTCLSGGVAGVSVGNVSNSFYSSSSNVSSSFGIGYAAATGGASNTGAEPKTLSKLMSKDTYSGWNFDTLLGFAAADNNNCPVFLYNYILNPTTTITATAENGKITVNWEPVYYATSYKVYYRQANESYDLSRKVDVDGEATTTANVTGLINGTTYYFVARAFNDNSSSINSDEVSGVPEAAPTAITAGKGLAVVTSKPQYASVKIPFVIDSQSFSKNLTNYSVDIIYDSAKLGTVTVDSFNGLTKPTIGVPVDADSSKKKVTITWNGTFTGKDLNTVYNLSKGALFKLNFVAKEAFTSGDTPIEIGVGGSCNFASGASSSIIGSNGNIMSGMYGDVNGDGAIISSDTNLINKYVSGKTTAITGEAKLTAADVNGDGSITASDAREISNYISGKASTLKTLFGY